MNDAIETAMADVVEGLERLSAGVEALTKRDGFNADGLESALADVVEQIKALAQSGNAKRTLTFRAPVSGIVTEKKAVQGMRFMAGEMLLTLADLSRVWLVANVPASDSAQLALGQSVQFRSTAIPGRSFEGAVTFIAPTFDEASRTLTVRVELDNAEGVLRPGLFGDVEFNSEAGAPVLSVPRSAVLDSGTRRVVFVELAAGRFEPRPVAIGRRSGDRVEISDGLEEGESVVATANFLIDAESNLGAALDGLKAPDHAGHGTAPAGRGDEQDAGDAEPDQTPADGGHQHAPQGG